MTNDATSPYPLPAAYVALDTNEDVAISAEAYPVDELAASVEAHALVQVQAPADLPGGYELVVSIHGRSMLVEVPEPGVVRGEQFQAMVLNTLNPSDPDHDDDMAGDDTRNRHHHIPQGAWRDGICDCCVHGPCHPHCCMACWCSPLALGQVMTRLQLDACGNPRMTTPRRRSRSSCSWSPFRILLVLTLLYIGLDHALSILVMPYIHVDESSANQQPQEIPGWVVLTLAFRGILRCSMALYLLIATIRTRFYVRTKYEIPQQDCCCGCRSCDDCCRSFWCHCCTISQMMRHTADYRTYRASLCSETGLPQLAPAVV